MDRHTKRRSRITQENNLSTAFSTSDTDDTSLSWMDNYNTCNVDMEDCLGAPFLELMERNTLWTGKENQPFYQAYKGLVKLAIYFNSGLLTVNVIEGKDLKPKTQKGISIYTKITIVPDDKRTVCQTKEITKTVNPVFNEKFSLELSPQCKLQRLLVGVYCKVNGKSDLLGCMSFGINHLLSVKKSVSGWYYLLADDLGKKKHLKVKKQETKTAKRTIPKLHSGLLWMDPVTLSITRGERGFGFTVVGSCPVRVGRVENDSGAWRSGLRTGDYIVRVNGQNVSRSTAESVVRLVRNSPSQIQLSVQRPQALQNLNGSPRRGPTHSSPPQRQPLNMPEECKENGVDVGRHGVTNSRGTTTVKPCLSLSFQDLPSSEQKRQQAVEKLLSCERLFIHSMQCGIQQYSRPLRHSLLSANQHALLFQNIEKIVTISQYFVQQLEANRVPYAAGADHPGQGYIDSVGTIYKAKTNILCDAYETYCSGLQTGLQLLDRLQDNTDFQEFMQYTYNSTKPRHTKVIKFCSEKSCESEDEDGDLDIEGFLHSPPEHIRQLLLLLQSVSSVTPSEHQDYEALRQTIEDLRSCCNMIYSRAHDSSPSTVTSNPEVLQIQNRMTFAQNVPVFQLYSPGRRLVHSGELLKVEGRRWIQLSVYLFSDLLLLAVLEPDDYLVLVEEPIYLRDITRIDFNKAHPSEFNIEVCKRDVLTLRASSEIQKEVWQNLMENYRQLNQNHGVHLEDSHIPKPWGSGDALDIPVEGYRNSPSPDLHRAGGRHNRKSHSDCHPKASLAVTKQYEGSHSLGIPQTKPKHKTGFNFFSHLPSRRHSSSDKEQNQQNFETHCEIITEQFQDKCSTGSSGNSRDGKHAYDSAIELEMDSGKVYTSQEHLNVPLPSPTSDFQEASTETSEKNSQKENDSKASRKNRFKRMMRPISRSHSAGCGKDVPAHALFLASRRNSQPSEPQVIVEAPEAQEKTKKKSKSIVKDVKRRLQRVRRSHTDGHIIAEGASSRLGNHPSANQALAWGKSFEDLLSDRSGLAMFQDFLRTEFSEENIEFWIACEDFKNSKGNKLQDKAQKIYSDFVAVQAPKEINLDSKTRVTTLKNINNPDRHAFDQAQKRIQALMEKDSYPRFLQTDLYKQLVSS